MPSQMILPITNLHPSHSLLEKPNSTSDDDPITITTTTTNSLLFEDEKTISIKPLLPRTLSYTNSTTTTTTTSATYYQQRRRRIASENSLSSLSSSSPDRRNSFGHDVGHAAAETFLITRLSLKLLRYLGSSTYYQQHQRQVASENSLYSLSAGSDCHQSFDHNVGHAAAEMILVICLSLKLLRYLGVGYKWITRFLALSCYSFLLFPGFFQVGYYYFFSSQVRRSIVYGDQPRNRLDLYLPKNNDGPKPVIAFVTGGAWIIGYKAWGCLLGQQLSERDIIVACIDYRNFPQGTMSDMVKDASQGISFVCNNIAEYGGDPDRIYLMGQSAGAHIAACTLVEQAINEAGEGESTSWSVSQIKAYFGLSGGWVSIAGFFEPCGILSCVSSTVIQVDASC
uniref:protein-S-isoprenylcysteine alpha-carbonyl methylesterase n=1 Tax=Quercus lobata TaxID=97700 RepID=A0A7N2L8W8_QUELO